MDSIGLYNVSFTGCGTAKLERSEKLTTIRTACAPLGKNGTNTECASSAALDRECDDYTIFAEERVVDGIQLQCYIECSVSQLPAAHHPANAAVTIYPTFVITFAALLFVLILSSKRSH